MTANYLNETRAKLKNLIAEAEATLGVERAWPITEPLLRAHEAAGQIARKIGRECPEVEMETV